MRHLVDIYSRAGKDDKAGVQQAFTVECED